MDCSNHKKDLFGETDMKKVATAIEDLHYEAMAELFNHLAERYMIRRESDTAIDRTELAQSSLWMHYAAAKLSYGAERAWKISKPHMQ